MHYATLRLEGLSDVEKALFPEIGEKMARSEVSLRKEGDVIIIDIKAENTTALRASLSSYLRYLSAVASAKKAMEE